MQQLQALYQQPYLTLLLSDKNLLVFQPVAILVLIVIFAVNLCDSTPSFVPRLQIEHSIAMQVGTIKTNNNVIYKIIQMTVLEEQ